jgi:hypothetical protein
MAIRNLFPGIKPSLNLDFANTKQLDPRITFARATPGNYYDGKTFAKAEENLLSYSQDFANASWGKESISIVGDSAVAPDGTSTADSMVESSASFWHRASKPIGSSGSFVLSVYAKPLAGSRYLTLGAAVNGGDHASATFDLSALTSTTYNGGSTLSISAAAVTTVGSWLRCSITFSSSATIESAYIGLNNASSFSVGSRGFNTYTGDGTSGLYVWGAQLEQRSSVTAYTPTTSQPITNYIPVLMTAPAGVARFDHNPVTGESLGLLIEEQRVNLLTYSEQFDNVAWTATNCSVAANAIVAPDGALTADKVKASAGTNQKSINRNGSQVTATIGTTYTYSVYLKAAEQTSVVLYFQNAASSGYVTFNLSAGTASAGGSITSVGNGWYRCSISGVATTASVYPLMYFSLASITGDGYSGFYTWGAQLEAGAFATSYIKTEASQVTRSADDAKMTGTNFSSWYSQDAGTFFGHYSHASTTTNYPVCLDVTSGSFHNEITLYGEAAIGEQFFVRSLNVTQANITASSKFASGVFGKIAGAYSTNAMAAAANGAAAVSDALGTVPQVDRMHIGQGYENVYQLNGTIKRIAYYPERLTNEQLQALTY